MSALRFPLYMGLSLALAIPAAAHQSFFQSGVTAASDSLLEINGLAQYGFSRDSNWYLQGTVSRAGLPSIPRQDVTRFGLTLGTETQRFGLRARYRLQLVAGTGLIVHQGGGGASYRFLPLNFLTKKEEYLLSKEDRLAVERKRVKEYRESIPSAPVLYFDYDALSIIHESTGAADASGRFTAAFTWKFQLIPWNATAALHLFAHSFSDESLGAGSSVWDNRQLRFVPIGVNAPSRFAALRSGSPGLASNAAQLFVRKRNTGASPFEPALALTRITQLTSGADEFSARWSVWLSTAYRFGRRRRWLLTPIYEHVVSAGGTLSFFTVRVGYEFSPPFIP